MRIYVSLYFLFFSTIFSFAQTWDNIIEDKDITQTIDLRGSEWNNTLIRNCRIHDTGQGNSGIFLQSLKNVRIENCKIYNIQGHAGIQISNIGTGTDNVQIVGNTIYNVQGNGITAPQRCQSNPPVNQTNLQIIDNNIYNTGLGASGGSYHSIYCQATDFLIKKNRLYGVRDGNAISVRSSGVISGNIVSGWSKSSKPGIRYFSDHYKGPSNTLVIENNIVWNDSTNSHCIEIFRHSPLYQNSMGDLHVVKSFNIRFNTCVSFQNDRNAINIHNDYGKIGYNTTVDGNIAISLQSENSAIAVPNSTSTSGNYVGTDLNNFVNSSAPFDFRITIKHQAVNYATGVTTFPDRDINGNKRTKDVLDAGAYQISNPAGFQSSK